MEVKLRRVILRLNQALLCFQVLGIGCFMCSGQEVQLSNLVAATRSTDLTEVVHAEWRITRETINHGVKSKQLVEFATELFCARLSLILGCEVPEVWKISAKHEFLNKDEPFDVTGLSFIDDVKSLTVALPTLGEFILPKEVTGVWRVYFEFTESHVLIVGANADSLTSLYLFDRASRKLIQKLALSTTCNRAGLTSQAQSKIVLPVAAISVKGNVVTVFTLDRGCGGVDQFEISSGKQIVKFHNNDDY